jgi:hypothetical protein
MDGPDHELPSGFVWVVIEEELFRIGILVAPYQCNSAIDRKYGVTAAEISTTIPPRRIFAQFISGKFLIFDNTSPQMMPIIGGANNSGDTKIINGDKIMTKHESTNTPKANPNTIPSTFLLYAIFYF